MLRPRSATRARNISKGGQRLGRSGVIWGSWRGRAARPEGHGGSSTRSPKRAPRAPLICIYLHDQKRRELKEEEKAGGGGEFPLSPCLVSFSPVSPLPSPSSLSSPPLPLLSFYLSLFLHLLCPSFSFVNTDPIVASDPVYDLCMQAQA